MPGDFADDVFAVLRPAHDICGDFYDFVRKGDRMSFIVGMACCMDLDVGGIVGRINQTLAFRNGMSMFATAFVGVLDAGAEQSDDITVLAFKLVAKVV